jgi:hypothetical protein
LRNKLKTRDKHGRAQPERGDGAERAERSPSSDPAAGAAGARVRGDKAGITRRPQEQTREPPPATDRHVVHRPGRAEAMRGGVRFSWGL